MAKKSGSKSKGRAHPCSPMAPKRQQEGSIGGMKQNMAPRQGSRTGS